MDRSNKIAQAYGYAVCFIAIVTLLFSSKGIIDASFDMAAPLRADRYRVGPTLTSFEAYKLTRHERPVPGGEQTQPELTEQQLRQRFEDERADQIDNVKFRSMRSLVSNILLIVIASALFATHWRWLRRESATL